jgi:hypothetical protein
LAWTGAGKALSVEAFLLSTPFPRGKNQHFLVSVVLLSFSVDVADLATIPSSLVVADNLLTAPLSDTEREAFARVSGGFSKVFQIVV